MPSTELEAMKAVLYAFSRVRTLRENYVLKGGNALRLGHSSPRASQDLDFSIKKADFTDQAAEHEKALATFLALFERGLQQAEIKFGLTLRVTRAKIHPSKRDPRSFPSFEVNIGYSNTGERASYPNVVKVEISLNEVVCEDHECTVDDFKIALASLDDIIAEKLRSILQQIPRNRQRPRDFYDVWLFRTHHAEKLNPGKISAFLLSKAQGRSIVATKAAFEEREIFERGAVGFEQIEATLPEGQPFPSFEEAAQAVLALVAQLDIPTAQE